nr:hypothetical protein [uncultured Deefgea sp.]
MVTGARRGYGTSKAGKPFDMSQIFVQTALADADYATSKQEGFGFEQTALDCVQSLLQKMKLAQLKLPALLELEIGHELRFGKMQSLVVDYKLVANPSTGELHAKN